MDPFICFQPIYVSFEPNPSQYFETSQTNGLQKSKKNHLHISLCCLVPAISSHGVTHCARCRLVCFIAPPRVHAVVQLTSLSHGSRIISAASLLAFFPAHSFAYSSCFRLINVFSCSEFRLNFLAHVARLESSHQAARKTIRQFDATLASNKCNLKSVFIRGDLTLLCDSFYTLPNERLFLLMRSKYVSEKRPSSSRFKGAWAEFMCVASKQRR